MKLWLPVDLYFSARKGTQIVRSPWAIRRINRPHASIQVGLTLIAEITLIVDFAQASYGKR